MSKNGLRLPSGPSVRLPSPPPVPTSTLLDVSGSEAYFKSSTLLPIYFVLIPLAGKIAHSFLTTSFILPFFLSIGKFVKHYSDGELVGSDRTLVLLVAIHGFMTFVVTAVASVSAQATGPFGYRNKCMSQSLSDACSAHYSTSSSEIVHQLFDWRLAQD